MILGDSMRLDSFLSHLKYGSKEHVKKDIKAKKVSVNNTVVTTPSYAINPLKDVIFFEGERVIYYPQVTLMLHKPKGYVSANKDNYHKTIFELIKAPFNRYDLNIAGRLDIDTEGLIILTTDGALLHEIIHPKKGVYKTYQVTTEKPLTSLLPLLEIKALRDGKNTIYHPLKPIILAHDGCNITLQIAEGKFHQVKRMFEAINHQVIALKRIAIGNLKLDVPLGEYRLLSEEDIKKLFQ